MKTRIYAAPAVNELTPVGLSVYCWSILLLYINSCIVDQSGSRETPSVIPDDVAVRDVSNFLPNIILWDE